MEVVVGRVQRAHGIRGEVSVQVRTDEPERRFAIGQGLLLPEGLRPERRVVVAASRAQAGSGSPESGKRDGPGPAGPQRLLLRFAGIDDRSAAETLHGAELTVELDRAESPVAAEEFYDHQLIGLGVLTGAGQAVGTVIAVTHRPVQDLLSIDIDGAEVLVPFVAALVTEVDLTAGTLTVADVPGLLDPDTALSED